MPTSNPGNNPQYLSLLAARDEARWRCKEAYPPLHAALEKLRVYEGPAGFEETKGTAGFQQALAELWPPLYRYNEVCRPYKKAYKKALEAFRAACQEPDALPGVMCPSLHCEVPR